MAALGVGGLAGVWLLNAGHDDTARDEGNPLAICPVVGGAVKDNFGRPRSDHTHYGNDIYADFGTPVRATLDGTVSDSRTVGGSIVTLVAPDGSFTVGKHLSETTGEGRVRTGDVIGYVGKLNVPGARPHLHFEWHPGGGPAVDPFPYLSELCPRTRPPGVRPAQ